MEVSLAGIGTPGDLAPWRIVQLARPREHTRPNALWQGIVEVNRDVVAEVLDDDDVVDDDTDVLMQRYGDQRIRHKVHLLALRASALDQAAERSELGFPLVACDVVDGDADPFEPADVVGYTWVGMPLLDNQHLAECDPASARAQVRWTGIESALELAATDVAQAHGRTTLVVYAASKRRDLAPDEAVVSDPHDQVHLPLADPTVRFHVDRGYELAQAERHSMLRLPADVADLVAAPHDGYELVTWTGVTPEPYRDDLARLHADMALDVPMAELDMAEEQWDAARVVVVDETSMRGGVLVAAAARHVASGEIVGHSKLSLPDSKPEVAHQLDTLVRRDHRGHGLGLWLKAAVVAHVQQQHPALRRIHTWNATENTHMLAINHRLGFELASYDACWQKKAAARDD